jgi:hypothetical protein
MLEVGKISETVFNSISTQLIAGKNTSAYHILRKFGMSNIVPNFVH